MIMHTFSLLSMNPILYLFSSCLLLVLLARFSHKFSLRGLGKRMLQECSKPYTSHARLNNHEVATTYAEMIEKEGAGSWPPRSDFDRWPAVFVPYQEIYQHLLPLLSTTEPSLDDEVNIARCQNYRSLMRKLLAEKINLDEIERFLTEVEFGKHTSFSREAYNGFYACISVSRHAYRWATVPVVKVAQMEQFVDFPRELEVPWAYLKRYYGVIADGGNNTANILHTFNVHGERVLKINVGVPAAIMTAEEIFFRIFYDVELMALPIYNEMVQSILCFEGNRTSCCVGHLENINSQLHHLLKTFYENLHDSRMPRSIWLRYVQGFQAWGIGELIDGRFVKYDGLSGNNALAFQALDAFLGMPLYLKDEDMTRYIPLRQRNLVYTLQKYCFRGRVEGKDGERVAELFKMIAKQLKVFRAAHKTRVMPYLYEPAPERLVMTAGKSVIEGSTQKETQAALDSLQQLLVSRMDQTK